MKSYKNCILNLLDSHKRVSFIFHLLLKTRKMFTVTILPTSYLHHSSSEFSEGSMKVSCWVTRTVATRHARYRWSHHRTRHTRSRPLPSRSNPTVKTVRIPSAAASLSAAVELRPSRRLPAPGRSPCPYTTSARWCRAIPWSPPTTSSRCCKANRTWGRARRFTAAEAWPKAHLGTTRPPSGYRPRYPVPIRQRQSSVRPPAHSHRSPARRRIDSHWRDIAASLDASTRMISAHRTIIIDVCRPTSITVCIRRILRPSLRSLKVSSTLNSMTDRPTNVVYLRNLG